MTQATATATYDLTWVGDQANVVPRTTDETSAGDTLDEVCGASKCAEELSDLGLLRADLLRGWMTEYSVVEHLTAVYSSHKRRTFQTVEPTAIAAGLDVVQFPEGGTELDPEGTSASICPTVAAILNGTAGSTLMVSGHTGTLYKIMDGGNADECAGLGIDTSDASIFPKDEDGKIPKNQFGDVWTVYIDGRGVAIFRERKELSLALTTSGGEDADGTKTPASCAMGFGIFAWIHVLATAGIGAVLLW